MMTDTTALTEAFMGMDASLSGVETVVANYRSVTGNTDLDGPWEAVRTQCYAAGSTYLALTGSDPDSGPSCRVTPESVDHGITLLRAAADQVAAFQTRYRRPLNIAAATISTLITAAQNAQATASRSQAVFNSLDAALRSYPSIQTASAELDQAVRQLAGTRDYPAMVAATRHVTQAAARLAAITAAAPRAAEDAARALSSISTRLDAARTRLDTVRPAVSTLLKEFPAASSADVVHTETAAREHIDSAAALFARAQTHADPEQTLALAKQTRSTLAQADQLIDAAPNRLRLLRDLRADPKQPAEKTRFMLHDAQMYAVGRGLTQQWASVLDAQLQRIKTLENTLNTAHPDYWAYANGLDKVNDFIQSVVTKMRGTTR